jgi:hypothetical protein
MSYFARVIIARDLDHDFILDRPPAEVQHKDPGVSAVDCCFALYRETWITLFYVLLDFATVHQCYLFSELINDCLLFKGNGRS